MNYEILCKNNLVVNSKFGPIVVNKKDTIISNAIINYGYYNLGDIEDINYLINEKLKEKSKCCLYDIGANIGTYSLGFSKTFNERIFIRAFEPQKFLFDMMSQTFTLNKLSNIKSYRMAVSKKDEEVKVKLPNYNKANNLGAFKIKNQDNNIDYSSNYDYIKTTTIDKFDEEIDFIKIDVEGMEEDVLIGAKKTIALSRPICFIELTHSNEDYIYNIFKELDYNILKKRNDGFFIPKDSKILIPPNKLKKIN
tara:strand:+ start:167 stop:922 length:756 start_codon:yes stop_codon:yes gene_type:complete